MNECDTYNTINKYFEKGLSLLEKSDWDGALEQFKQVVNLYPYSAATYNNLGAIYLKKGENQEAIKAFSNALRIDENHLEARHNLAALLLGQAHYAQASYHYEQLLALTPEDIDARYHLGVTLMPQGRREEAIACFEAVLVKHPDHASVRYLLHALKGDEVPPSAPIEHVRPLFDSYASRFDEHVMQHLHYQAPERLKQALIDVTGISQASWRVLDLGCGTGLSGAVFRDFAAHLTGIDLSPKMLEVARTKNIYDELFEVDILQGTVKGVPTELIVAADVFVYIGDLAETFAACHTALLEGGYFVFSTEISETGNYVLTRNARYAHARSYIERLAKEMGFEILNVKKDILRKQEEESVEGWLFVLQKRT